MTGGYTFERLHRVQLDIPAGAEDECRAFWRDVLGTTEPTKPPVLAARGGCRFRGGGVEVHLGMVPEFRPSRKGHPGIQVDDLPGHRRFHTGDRLGNRREFLTPPPGAADG
ncbi:glyoxalase [Kitasatospora sp. NPDC001527]|uniref:glyoxalase n=1 Tax=Kitasatospora sp. NPDC001527 TaxID=3154519 RepID=UPI003323A336